MILQIFFWFIVFLILFSSLLYPAIIRLFVKDRNQEMLLYKPDDELPFLSIIIPVYNEEMIIVEKIRSLFYTLYPFNKFEVLVGSDASYDQTNRIMQVYAQNYRNFYFFNYKLRRGKSAVVNELSLHAKGDILIITDANVLFRLNTLFEIVKYFRDPGVGFVDASPLEYQNSSYGKGFSKRHILSDEISLYESRKRSFMIIPYGGCYAIRKKDFREIPRMNLSDDVFLNMSMLSKGYFSIRAESAEVEEEEPVNHTLQLEREIRLAKGMYQNTFAFLRLLWPVWRLKSLGFFSRMLIPALSPFLLVTVLILNFFLLTQSLYQVTFGIQIAFLFLAGIDVLFRLFKVHIVFLRFVSAEISKNLVIFLGFLSFLAGTDFGLWQPIRKKNVGQNKT